MKKLFPVFLLAAVLFNFNIAYSQISLTVNGGIEIPTGNFSNLVKNGYGLSASIGYSVPIIPVEICVSAGYDNWPYKIQYSLSNSGLHEFGNGVNMYSIPVTIGPKLFINIPGVGFEPYIGIEAGVVSSSSTLVGATSITDFIYSPEIGFRYNLPLGLIAIDVNVKESNFTDTSGGQTQTYSWFGINAGIAISL
ncbi:MAG: hypothetical protein ABR980_12005 [Ignavibacteriaceae bacterium]|jgi:hypothetical protein